MSQQPPQQQPLRKFLSDEACVQFLPDGRNVRVVDHDIVFVDSQGNTWRAPIGLKTDGGSVPWIAEPVVGGPFESRARDGYILHDAAYQSAPASESTRWAAFRSKKRQAADKMLYEAALARGMKKRHAWEVWAGVRVGGWKPWMEHAQAKLADNGSGANPNR